MLGGGWGLRSVVISWLSCCPCCEFRITERPVGQNDDYDDFSIAESNQRQRLRTY